MVDGDAKKSIHIADHNAEASSARDSADVRAPSTSTRTFNVVARNTSEQDSRRAALSLRHIVGIISLIGMFRILGLFFTNATEPLQRVAPTEKAKRAGKLRWGAAASNHSGDATTKLDTALIPLPPLASLINPQTRAIISDVQFLLDFAILGHAKTGTTTLMHWIAKHPQVEMETKEIRFLERKNPMGMVTYLYNMAKNVYNLTDESTNQYKLGYKSPQDITKRHSLDYLGRHWPKTRLIIGVRHPVRAFESFYNYRIRDKFVMSDPERLIGSNCGGMEVCTDAHLYHVHLSYLGKTNSSDPAERELLTDARRTKIPVPAHVPNPVFLYDMTQMENDRFRVDLSKFLGLETAFLPPPPKINAAGSSRVGIDICEVKHERLRSVLMDNARNASLWIRNYFLKSPDIVVSSPPDFEEMMNLWMKDPCTDEM